MLAAGGPRAGLPVERMPRAVRPGADRGWLADSLGVIASLVPADLVNEGVLENGQVQRVEDTAAVMEGTRA